MIRINLLPAELRRGNRLAAKVLVASFVSALAVSASIGWFGVVWFGQLAASEQKLAGVEQRLAAKQEHVAYHAQLQANRTDCSQRVQTIQDIAKSRRLWSRFLDQMINVVNNNGDTERHLAWFSRMQVTPKAKGAVKIDLPSNVQGDDSSRMANFHEDIESAPFAKDYIRKSDPSFTLQETDGRTPPYSLSFPLTLELASRDKGKKKKQNKKPGKKPAKK